MLPIAVLGAVYAVFAFVGVGHKPFLLALALAAAGLPLYAFMRLRPTSAVA
jgi:APA family basic amino acid/polyamine antiporter